MRGVVGGGGESHQDDRDSPQLTPQERIQYEWYVKEFQMADLAADRCAERERISMIMTALMTALSERHERKVGKKKGPQGETQVRAVM